MNRFLTRIVHWFEQFTLCVVQIVCALINSRNMEISFYKITWIRASGLNWKFFLLSSSEISIRSKTMGGRGHYTGSLNTQKEENKVWVRSLSMVPDLGMLPRFSEPMIDTLVTSQNVKKSKNFWSCGYWIMDKGSTHLHFSILINFW